MLSGLRQISAALGRPAVIIPTDDEAALFVAEHRNELRRCFLAVAPKPDVIRSVSDKAALAATCRRIGVPTPAIACPATIEELSDFLDAARFPVVVKAVDAGQVRTQNVRSTTIAADRDEAWSLWTGLGTGAGSRLIFQEYIADGDDWFFHGFCDERSRLVVGYSGVKVRSYPAYAGPTSYGRWEANDVLTRQVQCLLEAVGYQGVFDLDLRLDRRDGLYKLLDFNPRVGAQFRLFRDEQDVDVLRALHLHLTGRSVPPVKARLGRTYMLETSDPVSLLRYRRDGRATFREWFEEVRAVDEWAWWARDDLRPSVIAATRLMLRRLRRACRARGPKTTGELRARRNGAAACTAPGRVTARS
jgi:predicted ATP-grasp superfamily ATP-dependent carboligase